MVGRTLFIFSFSFFWIFWQCSARPDWHKTLPNGSRQALPCPQFPSRIYAKPNPPKNNLLSPRFQYSWSEEIRLEPGSRFERIYREKKVLTGTEPESAESHAHGSYQCDGNWVLFRTETLVRTKCRAEACQTLSPGINLPQALVYHYSSNEDSLAALEYESNFQSKSFGIVWEVKNPYTEDELFFRIRGKYAKKEFQPHAYFGVRLE